MFEARPMSKAQQTVNAKKANCTDCLHCKVSAVSTGNRMLCFCSKEKTRQYDLLFYWLNKSVCKKFESMAV